MGGHKVVSRHPPTLHGKLKRTLRRTKQMSNELLVVGRENVRVKSNLGSWVHRSWKTLAFRC